MELRGAEVRIQPRESAAPGIEATRKGDFYPRCVPACRCNPGTSGDYDRWEGTRAESVRLVRLDRVPGERTVLRGSHFLPWLRSRSSVSDAFVAALDRRPSPEAAGKFDTLFRGEITSRKV